MQNTMDARLEDAESIEALISSQEKLGVVSKTAQLGGTQELSTYLTKKETLEKLIPVMNDMIAQQYGINASQESAANIATMLGKVMDGQTGALSRYGYKFDEAQEKILKYGTEEERCAVLTEVVTSSIGGMNEALGQTDAGKMAQLSAALEDTQARIVEVANEININGYEIPGTRGSGRKDTEKFLYGAITQLNNLIRNPGLKAALCGKNNILDFDKALETGSVITACSRKGDLGMIQAKAFGMFFILQFQDAVLRRKGNEDSRTPHFLYIDEFPEYITKDMEVMFTLFRKYRCGVTVALQNLSQLEKSGQGYYRQTVLANTKTQIVFGDTVPEDSKYWELAFGKEKKPDESSKYNISTGELVKTKTLEIKKKERAEAYKIQDQGFGAVYYKTKNAAGKTVYGQGKTSFLDAKYKEPFYTDMYNFEKYMMTKPDEPTIKVNDSDSKKDDILFNVDTTSKLDEKMKALEDEPIVPFANDTIYANSSDMPSATNQVLSDDFEIVFDDEPTLEDSSKDGGAITETYETPTIKENKGKKS